MCLHLTLFVSSENPDFNVGQREDSDGLWDTFLQLVLNGCGPQELHTRTRTHTHTRHWVSLVTTNNSDLNQLLQNYELTILYTKRKEFPSANKLSSPFILFKEGHIRWETNDLKLHTRNMKLKLLLKENAQKFK